MATLTPKYHTLSPPFIICSLNSSNHSSKTLHIKLKQAGHSSRRTIIASTAAMAALFLSAEAMFNPRKANCFYFRMTVPDQTLEEAESGIRGHAQDLLDVKSLIEMESWKEAQKALRKSSSYLKQDIYTIIQAKPGNERPQMRKLYSQLFNNVTRLDYAARSQDAARVWECYNNIVNALNDILLRL